MSVPAFKALTEETQSITQKDFVKLIEEREQLRILKNYIKAESVITKNEIITLINAMEVNNE